MWFKVIMINPKALYELEENEIDCLVDFINKQDVKCIFFTTKFDDLKKIIFVNKFSEKIKSDCSVLTKENIGKNKGSPLWIKKVSENFKIPSNKILILGRYDCPLDWRTAVNGNSLFVSICKKINFNKICSEVRQYGILFPHLKNFLNFLNLFFKDTQPLYTYKYDSEDFKFRCLLDAGSTIKINSKSITLQQLFTYEAETEEQRKIQNKLRFWLTFFFLIQLYKEGFLNKKTVIGIYPSHNAGKLDEKFAPYLEMLKGYLARNYFKESLIKRLKDTVDKSLARKNRQDSFIKFENEFNTIEITENVKEKIVIIFDDFSTTGMSLECARLKLMDSQPKMVILCAIGKYGYEYTKYFKNGNIQEYILLMPNGQAERKILDDLQKILQYFRIF